MNPTDVVWLAVVVLGTAAATAAAAFPLGVRWGARHAEHRAEHEIVQAVLWATEPLEVLSFYAQYRLAPPDVSAYVDDQIARDPALDQLTRRPEGRQYDNPLLPLDPNTGRLPKGTQSEWPRHADGTPVGLEGFTLRPAVPPPDEDLEKAAQGILLWPKDVSSDSAATPPPAVTPNPAATSHRAMRRPLAGWLEDTWARLTNRAAPVDETRLRTEAEEEIDGLIAGITEARAAAFDPELPPLPAGVLIVAGDPLCARCKGTQRIVDEVPAIRITDVLEPARTLWRPCPDCCCPEYGCGTHTGDGRLCPPHQHDDDIREEAAAKRAADL